jgi:uncharacterized protein (DUF983 family)
MSPIGGFIPGGPPSAGPANSNVPPFLAGMMGRCPRCGAGKLYAGFLTLAPRCTSCDLDYAFIDAGDGPAVFVILIVGFIVMAAALYTEVKFRPPIWLPLVVGLSLGLLRPIKGILVALQYANNARPGRLQASDNQPDGPTATVPKPRDEQTP